MTDLEAVYAQISDAVRDGDGTGQSIFERHIRAAQVAILRRYIDKWGELYLISGQSIVDQMRTELSELERNGEGHDG